MRGAELLRDGQGGARVARGELVLAAPQLGLLGLRGGGFRPVLAGAQPFVRRDSIEQLGEAPLLREKKIDRPKRLELGARFRGPSDRTQEVRAGEVERGAGERSTCTRDAAIEQRKRLVGEIPSTSVFREQRRERRVRREAPWIQSDRGSQLLLGLGAAIESQQRRAKVRGDGDILRLAPLRLFEERQRFGRPSVAQQRHGRRVRRRNREKGAQQRDHACAPRSSRSRRPSWFIRKCTLRRSAPGPNSSCAMRARSPSNAWNSATRYCRSTSAEISAKLCPGLSITSMRRPSSVTAEPARVSCLRGAASAPRS